MFVVWLYVVLRVCSVAEVEIGGTWELLEAFKGVVGPEKV